jgi:hypothetical protein
MARGKEMEVQAERARTQAIQDFKNLLDSTKNYYSERDSINQSMKLSERALIARINRKLTQHEVLRKSRQRLGYNELGDFYIRDFRRGFIVSKDVNIANLGVELR